MVNKCGFTRTKKVAMKKIKISTLAKTDQIVSSDLLLIANNQKLINSSDLINREFANICPDLSAFILQSTWSFSNGVLQARNITKWVSAVSPTFTVKQGIPYTLTVIFDRIDFVGAIQPVTGATQHTKPVSSKGLIIYTFIPTSTNCFVNIYSSADTPNNIDVSYIKIEEGKSATGIIPLLTKKVFS